MIARTLLNPKLSIALIAIGILAIVSVPLGLGIAGAFDDGEPKAAPSTATPDYSSAVISDPSAVPTPPAEMALIDKEGFILSPQWDDRHLTDEEKALDPIVNPRWEPFARCMESAGFTVRSEPNSPFLQADLDALVARLNQTGPLVTNEDGQFVVHHTPESAAFADCSAWALQVFSEHLYRILTPAELAQAQAEGLAPADSPAAEGTPLAD